MLNNLEGLLNNDWKQLLQNEFQKQYFYKLEQFLVEKYKTQKIFPKYELIFEALNTTPYKKVKVVILGQDPYHNNNQANGLCFSVSKGIKIPPSLKNIIKELKDDVNIPEPMHGDLTYWAKQGVLLLNTVLTVKAHNADSHKNVGWEMFTDSILQLISLKKEPVVYLIWGKKAAKKIDSINNSNHLILESHHPSPLSAYRGFFGCNHFSKTNDFLIEKELKPIDWEII